MTHEYKNKIFLVVNPNSLSACLKFWGGTFKKKLSGEGTVLQSSRGVFRTALNDRVIFLFSDVLLWTTTSLKFKGKIVTFFFFLFI